MELRGFAAMDDRTENDLGAVAQVLEKVSRASAMEADAMMRPDTVGGSRAMPSDECSASAQLGKIARTFEPLKVCLDDDSSIDDSDDDMFDDDAFTFGDDDFETLMSHESMKRMTASIRSHAPKTPAAATLAAQNSLLPLHHSSSLLSDKAGSSCGADFGVDSSLPTTAASSTASLCTLTLASYASSPSITKKTKTKRRVSLHNDVAVIPIPMRTEYPTLVRERIWSSANEIYQNAARNTIEFAAEGFDWRNAADDTHMVHSASGERIHPIHYRLISCNGTSSCEREIRKKDTVTTPVSMDSEPLAS